MNELVKIQQNFQSFLMGNSHDIIADITETKTIPIATRLAIYQEAYELRLIECLAYNYPGLQQFIGSPQFADVGRAYLKRYPSSFRSIRWFGHKLPQFLHEKYSIQWAEMADFEWKMALSFDAENSTVLTIEQLAAIESQQWAKMQLLVHPCVYHAAFNWNTVDTWHKAMQQESAPPRRLAATEYYLIWRKNYAPSYAPLTAIEYWLFSECLNHARFAEICEGLCQWYAEEEVALQAVIIIKKWIHAGAFCRLQL